MRILPQISRSIGRMQAVAVLLASMMIGLCLSVILLHYSFNQQRDAAIELRQDILTLVKGGATGAAWVLDSALADEIIASVMAIEGVQFAEIRDDHGAILARRRKPKIIRGAFVTWFARTFVSNLTEGTTILSVTDQWRRHVVGQFSVALTPYYVVDNFLKLALSTIIGSFIAACLIGLVLLWVSARFVTRPLRNAASAIADIESDHSEQVLVPVPKLHRDNELGHLLAHTNDMLVRLTSSRDQLKLLATRDSLTGLPNRTLIQDRLTSALSRARRANQLVAVIFLDLDRFKNVNDSLGHEIGDELLVAVAEKLTASTRANDSVGRLGGDEFLIIVDSVDDPAEFAIAANRIIETISTIYYIGAQQVRVTASMGISVFPNDGEDNATLLRHADLAMYKAKGSDVCQWQFFSSELSEQVDLRVQLEMALVGALDRNEFELFYQPKYRIDNQRVAGCEALLRWKSKGRLVPADEFIAVAEDTGMIVGIGQWVIHQVCRQIQEWGDQAVPVALNVSTRQLAEADFAASVLTTAEHFGVAPDMLELEITESVVIPDLQHNFEVLKQLLDAGIGISIDDFGTGYSSLSYLSRLPINSLKIDRSFVSGSRQSEVLLSAIIAMAKALKLHAVAEGVETDEQYNMLVNKGCEMVQGYLLGRPVPANEFAAHYLKTLQIFAGKYKQG